MPSSSPAVPTPAIYTLISAHVSVLARRYPAFHAPAPPSTGMSYHSRQRRPAVEAATATAGRQKVIGPRTFSDTSGVSSVTPTPSATFRLVGSLHRYETQRTSVPRTILTEPGPSLDRKSVV